MGMPGCVVSRQRRGEVVERAAEDEEFSGGVKMGKGELFGLSPQRVRYFWWVEPMLTPCG